MSSDEREQPHSPGSSSSSSSSRFSPNPPRRKRKRRTSSSSTSSSTTSGEDPNFDFLTNREYTSKDEVISTVSAYSRLVGRECKVVQSDARRYYVRCVEADCLFQVRFNFRDQFGPPSFFLPHSCNLLVAHESSRLARPLYLAGLPEVSLWMRQEGRRAGTAGLCRLFTTLGLEVPYQVAHGTMKRLKRQAFASDSEQFKFLESYVESLNRNGNQAVLERDTANIFQRMAVAYWQGIQAFGVYSMRGLQLDATFIKNSIGGTLLVACLKDGNNNIMVVAIAVVSSENEANWRWFLQHLRTHLPGTPAFIISDRDKGLGAAARVFEAVPHFYCFRHVMENFNARFKDRELKDKAWGIAKAVSVREFDRAVASVRALRPESIPWLEAIGFDKLTLVRSPVCRYGVVTSNNAESVNSRIREDRGLPILELLLRLEQMVVTDRTMRFQEAQGWMTSLTRYAYKNLRPAIKEAANFILLATSLTDFVVTAPTSRGSRQFQVSLAGGIACSCEWPERYLLPCSHALFVVQSRRREVEDFCCHSWTKEAYLQAYAEPQVPRPLTIRDDLTEGQTLPPILGRRRGRPRKIRRVESQPATRQLEGTPVRRQRCTRCHQAGHNRRRCPQPNEYNQS
jgi:MULE transposase domain/SWIM zinc finger